MRKSAGCEAAPHFVQPSIEKYGTGSESWEISYLIVPNANHATRSPRTSVCVLQWRQMRFNRAELGMRIARESEREFRLITDYNVTMLYEMRASLFPSAAASFRLATLVRVQNMQIKTYVYTYLCSSQKYRGTQNDLSAVSVLHFSAVPLRQDL